MNLDHLQLSPVPQVLAGLVLLFFGRKLFWLFVGVIGFLAGMRFGAELVKGQPEIVLIAIAVGIGLLAALLAIVLQRLAVAVAGGLAGGILAIRIAAMLGASSESFQWVFFLVGALLTAILVSAVFDWALVILSALIGANLVGELLPFGHTGQLIGMVVLFVLGVLVQSRISGFARA
jgi:Domain of unknown function (DUF4203)